MFLFYNDSTENPSEENIKEQVIQFNNYGLKDLKRNVSDEFPELTISQNITNILDTIQFIGKRFSLSVINFKISFQVPKVSD